MSDVSQGPGWWLASDGKWYPPHTAPQATLPPDAAATYPQYTAATPTTAEPGTTAETYGQQPAGQVPGQPGPYATAYPTQQYPGAYGTGYAYPTQGAVAGPEAAYGAAAPTTVTPTVPVESAPTPTAITTTVTAAPATRKHWQPWLAVVGIALVLVGAGQAVLAWANWRQVLPPHVSAQHAGDLLVAAGWVIAGLAVVVVAQVLDRR